MSEIISLIQQYWSIPPIVLVAICVFAECIKGINWNPITSLFEWMGKKFNADIKDEMDKTNQEVYRRLDIMEDNIQKLSTDFTDHRVESMRQEILDFGNAIMNNRQYTQENFNHIIKLHNTYEKYINEKGLENGEVDIAYEFITEKYKDHMLNNDFL